MRNRWADGDRLRAIRIQRQLTQKEVARRAKVRNDTLSSIEAGRYQPGDLLAHRLALALNCGVEDFSDPRDRRVAAA